MNKVDWKGAPEWADRHVFSRYSGNSYFGDGSYIFSGGEKCLATHNDFSLNEMRPDEWKKGEERMEQVSQNGNDGEHYAELEEGKKSAYHRKVKGVWIDFYDIAEAFDPENRNSADDHALKKMLLPGKRHTKGGIQDRREAIRSIERAIEMEQEKGE